MALICPCEVHRHLEIMRFPKFDIDADVLGKASHEQLCFLDRGEVACVA